MVRVNISEHGGPVPVVAFSFQHRNIVIPDPSVEPELRVKWKDTIEVRVTDCEITEAPVKIGDKLPTLAKGTSPQFNIHSFCRATGRKKALSEALLTLFPSIHRKADLDPAVAAANKVIRYSAWKEYWKTHRA